MNSLWPPPASPLAPTLHWGKAHYLTAPPHIGGGRPITSPLGSLDILDHCEDVLKGSFIGVEGSVLTHRGSGCE